LEVSVHGWLALLLWGYVSTAHCSGLVPGRGGPFTSWPGVKKQKKKASCNPLQKHTSNNLVPPTKPYFLKVPSTFRDKLRTKTLTHGSLENGKDHYHLCTVKHIVRPRYIFISNNIQYELKIWDDFLDFY
jgi:hypothetical protein